MKKDQNFATPDVMKLIKVDENIAQKIIKENKLEPIQELTEEGLTLAV